MNESKKIPPLKITLSLLYKHLELNDNSLSEEINKRHRAATGESEEIVSQTMLWRLSTGVSSQPRDSTVKPVADYFKMTIEQLKNVEYVEKYIRGETPENIYMLDDFIKVLKNIPDSDKEAALKSLYGFQDT